MWHSLKALSALALETAWVKVTELVSIHTMVSFCGVFLSIFFITMRLQFFFFTLGGLLFTGGLLKFTPHVVLRYRY